MFKLKTDIEKATAGWKCPYCGAVYAPSVKKCENCSKQENKEQNKQRLDD